LSFIELGHESRKRAIRGWPRRAVDANMQELVLGIWQDVINDNYF
jgi:hypothetical protein